MIWVEKRELKKVLNPFVNTYFIMMLDASTIKTSSNIKNIKPILLL